MRWPQRTQPRRQHQRPLYRAICRHIKPCTKRALPRLRRGNLHRPKPHPLRHLRLGRPRPQPTPQRQHPPQTPRILRNDAQFIAQISVHHTIFRSILRSRVPHPLGSASQLRLPMDTIRASVFAIRPLWRSHASPTTPCSSPSRPLNILRKMPWRLPSTTASLCRRGMRL